MRSLPRESMKVIMMTSSSIQTSTTKASAIT